MSRLSKLFLRSADLVYVHLNVGYELCVSNPTWGSFAFLQNPQDEEDTIMVEFTLAESLTMSGRLTLIEKSQSADTYALVSSPFPTGMIHRPYVEAGESGIVLAFTHASR